MDLQNPATDQTWMTGSEGPSMEQGKELFRDACRRLHVRLADRYDIDVPVRLGTAGLSVLEDAFQRQGRIQGSVVVGFVLESGEEAGVLVIQGPLLYRMAGALMGEPVDADTPAYRARPPTEVDLKIAQRLAADTLASLEDACQVRSRPGFRVVRAASGPRASTGFPRSASVVEITVDVGPPMAPYGLLTVVMPVRMLRLLLPADAAPVTARSTASSSLDRVLDVGLPVVVEFARVRLSLAAIRTLNVDDVIDLGVVRDVSVRVGEQVAVIGKPGQCESARSVRVKRKYLSLSTEG